LKDSFYLPLGAGLAVFLHLASASMHKLFWVSLNCWRCVCNHIAVQASVLWYGFLK